MEQAIFLYRRDSREINELILKAKFAVSVDFHKILRWLPIFFSKVKYVTY